MPSLVCKKELYVKIYLNQFVYTGNVSFNILKIRSLLRLSSSTIPTNQYLCYLATKSFSGNISNNMIEST